MTLLILGLVLWTFSHTLKRLFPGLRAAMGVNGGKGIVALLSVGAIVLMVLGYKSAEFVPLWTPPAFLVHVNNLLMLIAVFLFVSSGAQTWITRKIRHPQLTAAKTWALAHLLVNGDLASLVLFGGLMAWAVLSVILINRAKAVWVPEQGWPVRGEFQALIGTAIVFAVIATVHSLLGYWPFG